MRQKSVPVKEPATQVVKNIRRATRRHFSAEDKIRIVLEGLRGEDSIAELCRREGIVQNLWSGKQRRISASTSLNGAVGHAEFRTALFMTSPFGTSVWTGRTLQVRYEGLEIIGLAHLYSAL